MDELHRCMDAVSPEKRSDIMSRVRQKHTTPEVLVRQLLHSLGYRFRLHRADLPGTPDIVLPGKRTVIFVNGCFWHGHNCRAGRLPSTNVDFWMQKRHQNHERDARNAQLLGALGWKVIVVWECETKNFSALACHLQTQLSPKTSEST